MTANSIGSNHATTTAHSHDGGDEILLSKALLQMSVTDRNDIEEEIHGVRCLCPDETPQFLQEKLQQLQYELDHNIPPHVKRSYLKQEQYYYHYQQHPHPQHPITSSSCPYRSRAFRIQVLRCEVFDAHKAAHAICAFCTTVEAYFGTTALFQPIQLTTHFTKKEISSFRKGLYQYLPFRDRSGRRVCCCFPGTESIKLDNTLVVRTLLLLLL